jgi:WD40 repeat protein
MFSDQEAEVSLNVPAKCIASVADRTESRFLVGTCSTQEENHLHVLRFHSELNEFGVDGILPLPEGTGSMGSLCTCPTDKSLVLASNDDCHNTSSNTTVTLYQIPQDIIDKNDELEYKPQEEAGGVVTATSLDDTMMMSAQNTNTPESSNTLTSMATLNCNARLSQMVWRSEMDDALLGVGDGSGDEDYEDYNYDTTPSASSTSSEVFTLDWKGELRKWDLNDGGEPRTMRKENVFDKDKGNVNPMTAPRMAADPHNVNAMCVTVNENVHILDWRVDTSLPSGTVSQMKGCHRYGVTDVDYNPNKPYVLATSGQDALIKFWDIRYHSVGSSGGNSRRRPQPLLVGRGGHSHWVSNIKYNPFHDQLVVSTGTDSIVNLWRVSSISSAPLLQLDDENDDLGGSAGDIMFPSSGDGGGDITTDTHKEGSGGGIGGSNAANIRVSRYEHQDSIYDMAWGAADAWIYVTVAFDGKVVLNHVPSNEKYKILL